MMKRFTYLTFTLSGILLLFAGQNGVIAQNRTAILEEFRGHKCGNCPAGDVIANGLKSSYGEDLIVVSIHAGFLANPNSSGSHTTDFRTTAGNEYNTFYNVSATPVGLVNRAIYNGNTRLGSASWEGAVDSVLADSAMISVGIENGYNVSERELTLRITSLPLDFIIGEHSLVVYILEDSIIDDQTDYGSNPTLVQDYLHNHVLRDNVNGTWGTTLFVDSAGVNDTLINEYSYIINSDWKEKDISVVAYVYEETSKEILNAAELKIDLNAVPLFESDTTGGDTTTSISFYNNENKVVTFPNPAKDEILVQLSDPIIPSNLKVSVIDLQGRLVISEMKILDSNRFAISVRDLPDGMYWVRVLNGEAGYRKKIVVKHY